MRPFARWRLSLVALALVVASCKDDPGATDPETGGAIGAESDNATLRHQAMNEWYNESHTAGTTARSGPWSPAYRRFILDAAARERARWGALLPGGRVGKIAGTTWTNLGPTHADFLANGSFTLNVTDSGRLRSIVVNPVNPSNIFVATAEGGVWRSSDAGASWTPITETVGSLSCGSLAMDPRNPSILYLGLGDPFDGTGIGLIKSTDGGNTWSAPVYLGDSSVTTLVMVSPDDSNIVLATTNKGLFRSADAGASWTLVLAPGASPYAWTIAHTGANRFAVSLETNHEATSGTTDGNVYVSSDGGVTWTLASGVSLRRGTIGRITLASAPSNESIVYAMAAVPNATTSSDLADIFKSTDGGASFRALGAARKRYSNANRESRTLGTLLNGQGWYNAVVIVDPTDPNVAYFGGALLLAKTTDGGASYTQVSNWLAQFGLPYVHADFHAAAFAGATLYMGTDGGIFRSTDGAATWTDTLNNGLVTHLLYSMGSSGNNPSAIIGGMQDDGTRVRSATTPTTWNQVIGGDGFGSDVHKTNASLMLGSLYFDRIYKSTDGGGTFSPACTGISECNNSSSAPFITRIVPWLGSPTGDEVFTFSNTKVYKSVNYAGSWSSVGTVLSTGVIRNVGVAQANDAIIGVVASGGRVFLSADGGATWTAAASPPNNALSLSCVTFDASDTNTLYVASVAANAAASHLWKSTNFGASWTIIDGNGLPTGVPVNQIRQDAAAPAALYAATHLGVYESIDGGASWTRFGAGLPLVNTTDVHISGANTLVRAATYGRGFWELQ